MDNILGVRLPELRKLAKSIAKGEWRSQKIIESFRVDTETKNMLRGMKRKKPDR